MITPLLWVLLVGGYLLIGAALTFAFRWGNDALESYAASRNDGVTDENVIAQLKALMGLLITAILGFIACLVVITVRGSPTPSRPFLSDLFDTATIIVVVFSLLAVAIGIFAYRYTINLSTRMRSQEIHTKQEESLTLYQLPQDAQEVREGGCRWGIFLVVNNFPYGFKDDADLEAFVRGHEVLSRTELTRKKMQITNDFRVYCLLRLEGVRKGYNGFLRQCSNDPNELENTRQMLKNISDEDYKTSPLLTNLVKELLAEPGPEKGTA